MHVYKSVYIHNLWLYMYISVIVLFKDVRNGILNFGRISILKNNHWFSFDSVLLKPAGFYLAD